jgi:glycosyltransferase involved in cell wall biosynthesis
MNSHAGKVVGVDGHVLQGKFQGSRTFLENMLTEIGHIGSRHRFVVFSLDAADTAAKFPFANFAHVVLPVQNRLARLLAYWPYAERRYGLDCLLTQYIAPPLAMTKQLLVIHDILFETDPSFFPLLYRLRNRFLVRMSARRAAIIFVPSEFTAGAVARRYGIPRTRLRLTPDGVRVSSGNGKPPSPVPQAPYILTVGRIEPRKNLIQLGQAFLGLARPDVHLVVVGSPDFGYPETMSFLGGLPRFQHFSDVDAGTLAWLYRHAAVFVLPSLGEGFGIPLLEALAAGTPLVSSNRGALPEVGGALARYFDPAAPDATAVLARLIDEALASGFWPAPEAVEAHLARFDWRRSAETMLDAIDGL